MAAWVTNEYARARWADADGLADDVLSGYLASAQEQCEAFAPALAADAPVPERYRQAVVAQARSTYRAVELGNQDGGIGPDGYVVRTFPLDWQVQQLLRPKRSGPGLIA